MMNCWCRTFADPLKTVLMSSTFVVYHFLNVEVVVYI